MAHDLGQPVPYETTQPLQVALLDIDDNEPVFLKPPVSNRFLHCTGVMIVSACCVEPLAVVLVCASAWQLALPSSVSA